MSLVVCLAEVVVSVIQPSKNKIRIGGWRQFQSRARLTAGRAGISGALADLGESGMSVSHIAVRGDGRLVEPLGLQQQAAVEVDFGLGRELEGPFPGGERGQAL